MLEKSFWDFLSYRLLFSFLCRLVLTACLFLIFLFDPFLTANSETYGTQTTAVSARKIRPEHGDAGHKWKNEGLGR